MNRRLLISSLLVRLSPHAAVRWLCPIAVTLRSSTTSHRAVFDRRQVLSYHPSSRCGAGGRGTARRTLEATDDFWPPQSRQCSVRLLGQDGTTSYVWAHCDGSEIDADGQLERLLGRYLYVSTEIWCRSCGTQACEINGSSHRSQHRPRPANRPDHQISGDNTPIPEQRRAALPGSVSRSCDCQAILTDVKVIDVGSLPADPLEALRELFRADVELEALRRDRVEAARRQGRLLAPDR
jgi:hypothetical protein